MFDGESDAEPERDPPTPGVSERDIYVDQLLTQRAVGARVVGPREVAGE